jgi:hypothetical protein
MKKKSLNYFISVCVLAGEFIVERYWSSNIAGKVLTYYMPVPASFGKRRASHLCYNVILLNLKTIYYGSLMNQSSVQ